MSHGSAITKYSYMHCCIQNTKMCIHFYFCFYINHSQILSFNGKHSRQTGESNETRHVKYASIHPKTLHLNFINNKFQHFTTLQRTMILMKCLFRCMYLFKVLCNYIIVLKFQSDFIIITK